MKKRLRGQVYAGRFRMFADKIERYTNSVGSRIGWDGGLHEFLKMLDKAEKVLDDNIRKAMLKSIKKSVPRT